jgi:NAD(P)-dependent dehydrogenase (short-subunit alcohol dehydrogenase family)
LDRFEDRVVFITGGSKGIGLAAAEGFLSEGARVVICSRSKKNVDRAVRALKRFGNRVQGEAGDLSIEPKVSDIVARVERRFGKLDILVNSAGISKPAKIEGISAKEWHYILDNNLTNCFLMCKYVLRHVKKRRYGKIINVSSIAGRFRSLMAGIHYTCAKAAVIALTKQLAAEAGPYGINVNAICPGQTKREMLKPYLMGGIERELKGRIPLGYVASAEQQANVILFLASEEASYMTGAVVDVNGGQL